MTHHATHRFSVAQIVSCPRNSTCSCRVVAQRFGQSGPEYEISSSDGQFYKGVPERELAYGAPTRPAEAA
jgi:hypothetical protein